MSDAIDLTLLSGMVQGLERELRLLRLQSDAMNSHLGGLEQRLSGLEQPLAGLEQRFHELVGEMARGFGQMQQQFTRNEKRFDAVEGGLAALQISVAESTDRILQALAAR